MPMWGLELSDSFQSAPGEVLENNWDVGRGIISGLTQSGVDVALIAPGSLYADQITQLDLSLARAVEFGASNRLRLQLELFNVFNSNVVLNQRQTFGSRLYTPTRIMSARLVQIGASFNF